MKTKNVFFIAITATLLASCATTSSYYQVYNTNFSDSTIKLIDNSIVFEDTNCTVFYNFWGEGGNVGFKLYNKSDKNIYLNKEESFFVLNGISNNYYKARVFTNTKNTSSSMTQAANNSSKKGKPTLSSTSTSYGSSVSNTEEKTICIPAKTSKIISEYTINQSLIRDCDLFKYPNKKQISTKLYTKTNSPIVFSNRIHYKIANSEEIFKFENEFYVSEITNYPENEVFGFKKEEYCGQKGELLRYFKNSAPDKFYFEYKKDIDTWKH